MRKLTKQLLCASGALTVAGATVTATSTAAQAVPPAPPSITALTAGATSVSVNWTASATTHTYFISNGARIKSVNGDTIGFTWTGLKKSTRYCFKVRAVSDGGELSAWGPEKCIKTKQRGGVAELVGVTPQQSAAVSTAIAECLTSLGGAKLIAIAQKTYKEARTLVTAVRLTVHLPHTPPDAVEVFRVVVRDAVPGGACILR
ncbi:fibronectin type III domain-containing protein [Streptomyces sp. NPDC002755]|uniref:fibronectin type III domain-containing protein n=1 Tax=Streptomyces sp. NPDC002884 TaxID=3154544 RepID=UPI0033319D62